MRAVLAVLVAACTPRAVTPPVRTFVPDSPALPGSTDVSVGGGIGGSTDIFGASAMVYSGRARQTVEPGLALEGEAGVIAVGHASSYVDSIGYTGRLGIIRSIDPSLALTAGLGGGLSSTAGNWGSGDVGVIFSGTHPWVRPLLALSAGYAAPFGHRTFTVSDDSNNTTTLQLPRNLFVRADLGLEVGPRGAFLLGISYVSFAELSPDVVGDNTQSPTQSYLVIGAGARIPL
jgi:hypothetical protein